MLSNRPIVILILVFSLFFLLKKCNHSPVHILNLGQNNLICDFENKRVWDTSPESGFEIKLSKSHVTQGKHSLEVYYAKDAYPSINTHRFNHDWGQYDYFSFDVFNPEKEALDFSIRLDDAKKSRANISYALQPGLNKVKIPRSQIASQIDAGEIDFIVLFLTDPRKRYRLFFDNMRLERSGLIAGIEEAKPGSATSEHKDAKPLPVRKAVPLPLKKVETQGELKVALAKLKEIPNNRPLISGAIPFALGQLKDEKDFAIFDVNGKEIPIAQKVLARWPQDHSIRSVLVQFPYTIEHIYEYVVFKWGARRLSSDQNIKEPAWEYPEGMIILPAKWLCASGILGEQVPMGRAEFKSYDDKILKHFDDIKNKGWSGDVVNDNYYSTAHSFYQIYVRSGELKYFISARRELLHYRDTQVIQEGENKGQSTKNSDPRYIYTEALLDDYLLTGDPISLKVLTDMAEYLKKYLEPTRAYFPKTEIKFWTERLIAFPFLGVLNYYELTGDKSYLNVAEDFMENLYKTQLEWPSRGGFIHNLYSHDTEEGARQDEYGGSPFMTGLLLEPVIKLHRLTGNQTAADSIFRAVDWLIHEGLITSQDSFKYTTADVYKDSSGEPDLNLTIVHAFGYAYRLSGYQNEEYLNLGQKILERGVKEANLGDRKHFNQNYRTSGHYLAYIWDGLELKLTKQKSFTENQTAVKDILYFEGFENSLGRFKSGGDTDLNIDKNNTYLNGNSLSIRSKYVSSFLSAGINLDNWNLMNYPHLNFAYRIPEGTPVGIKIKSRFGDWVCLGGSKQARCADPVVKNLIELKDDGEWHEANLDIKGSVQSLLPGVEDIVSFQFYTNANATPEDIFWIDEFKIIK
jgi:hypothetical protein